MYDNLIKLLRNCATNAAPCKSCDMVAGGSCSDALMMQAADAIEELSKPKWIPVTERLPERLIPVLVCFDFKGRKSIDVAELWSDGGFHNYSDEYLTPEGRKHRKGTHWMPLPEPPKEEA